MSSRLKTASLLALLALGALPALPACGHRDDGNTPFYATRSDREEHERSKERAVRYRAAEEAFKAQKWDESEKLYRDLAAEDARAWAPRVRLATIAGIKHEYGEQERWL